MPISQNIGGLPILSWIFDYGPIAAFLTMFFADFGVIYCLMIYEGKRLGKMPWKRDLYKTFLWNDTIFIPIFLGVAVVILKNAPTFTGFYRETWWHVLLLVSGFGASLAMEWLAMKNGQFTWSQELSPSKLWHTFIFGIVFYWLSSVVIPMLVHQRPLGALVIAGICFTGFVWMSFIDARNIPRGRYKDAHESWNWGTMTSGE